MMIRPLVTGAVKVAQAAALAAVAVKTAPIVERAVDAADRKAAKVWRVGSAKVARLAERVRASK